MIPPAAADRDTHSSMPFGRFAPIVASKHQVYERQADNRMRFVGLEYLTFQAVWHNAGNATLPQLFDQRFDLNPTLLDEPSYLLRGQPSFVLVETHVSLRKVTRSPCGAFLTDCQSAAKKTGGRAYAGPDQPSRSEGGPRLPNE